MPLFLWQCKTLKFKKNSFRRWLKNMVFWLVVLRALRNCLRQNPTCKIGSTKDHFHKRLDPSLLVEGSKTVICFAYNYFPKPLQTDITDDVINPNAESKLAQSSTSTTKSTTSNNSSTPQIAKYAWGDDYHHVIKEKLFVLMAEIQNQIPNFNGRAFVDSAPVMERQWAERAGLGWIGKNSLLLNRQLGSFFFLAELVIDLEASPDLPIAKDYCGTCTACMDACPTDAIVAPGVVDGSRCISYLTIELKDAIPSSFAGKMDNWVFGCDVCQDVCPWNRFSKPHQEPAFTPSSDLQALAAQDWKELTEETFKKVFSGSAVNRTKFKGIKRNMEFLSQDTSSD